MSKELVVEILFIAAPFSRRSIGMASFMPQKNVSMIVIFWPSTRPKNAIPRWCTGRKWHIPMASNRKRSRGRIKAYNMGPGEGPTEPLQWCTGKRVTCELHDSYFCLMTIKHSISKIQWVIVWALNYYLTQLRSGCQSSCQESSRRSYRRNVVRKTTSGRRGLWALMSEPLGPRLGSPREQERHNVTVITVGSKYEVYVRSPAPSHMQTLNNPFEPLQ